MRSRPKGGGAGREEGGRWWLREGSADKGEEKTTSTAFPPRDRRQRLPSSGDGRGCARPRPSWSGGRRATCAARGGAGLGSAGLVGGQALVAAGRCGSAHCPRGRLRRAGRELANLHARPRGPADDDAAATKATRQRRFVAAMGGRGRGFDQVQAGWARCPQSRPSRAARRRPSEAVGRRWHRPPSRCTLAVRTNAALTDVHLVAAIGHGGGDADRR